eukprot:scpid28978/ scgid14530/ 
MSSSPPPKKRKTKQLTLFGGCVVDTGIYKKSNPSSYEEFIDAFVERYGDGAVRADVVRQAQAKWSSLKDNEAGVREFVAEVGKWKAAQESSQSWLGIQRPESPDCVVVESTSSVTPAAAATNVVTPVEMPLTAPTSNAETTFLESVGISAEKLLTREVVEQACFMTEFKEFVRAHARFQNAKEKYLAHVETGVGWSKKTSSVKDGMESAQKMVFALAETLKSVAAIVVPAGNILGAQTQLSLQRKSALLTEAAMALVKVKALHPGSRRSMCARIWMVLLLVA